MSLPDCLEILATGMVIGAVLVAVPSTLLVHRWRSLALAERRARLAWMERESRAQRQRF